VLIHSVYFWLKPALSPSDLQRFAQGLRSLAAIRSVRRSFVGTPAATEPRPVIDASWSYALTVFFDDVAGHDAYQVDPIHDRFVADCSPLWRQVRVYDATADGKAERIGE
jgi:hypothetical protein